MIKILVSIVNYNSYNDTLKLINFISNKLNIDGYLINFFIVDNSSDKQLQTNFINDINKITSFSFQNTLEQLEDKVNYVYDSQNNGFGSANNIVIDYVNNGKYYDVIWLLNNDLELDVNCLSSLKQYLNDDDYPVLGSVIIEDDCTIYGTDNMNSFKGFGTPSIDKINSDIFEVDAAIGTSMFLKRIFLKNLKFDEKFFMYVEENDLCFRFKELGIKSYIVKNSKVYHYSGKTFGDNQSLRWYYKVRNLLYFKSKNNSKNIFLIPYLLLSTLKNYKFDISYLKAFFYGVHDYIKNNFGKTDRNFR